MPDLPAHLDIGPHRWTVQGDDQARRHLGGNGRWGETNPEALTIAVDTDRPYTQVAETLLHETLHAVWRTVNVAEDADEEQTVNALTPTLLAVLRANPALAAYLTAAGS